MQSSQQYSNCDLELIMDAAEVVYNIDTAVSNSSIQKKGYTIIDSKQAPKLADKTPLSATCLIPNDETSPLIVSFKGTNPTLLNDLCADINLATLGVAYTRYRNDAYKYYQLIRQQYPSRTIILTGHSLGGNLAQYVGVKAYATTQEDKLKIRTFNSAPVKSKHDQIFKTRTKDNLDEHFINYRLQNDKISKNYISNHYGTMISISSTEKSFLKAHEMAPMRVAMKQLLGQKIATSDLALSQEKVLGIFTNLQYIINKRKIKDANPIDTNPIDEEGQIIKLDPYLQHLNNAIDLSKNQIKNQINALLNRILTSPKIKLHENDKQFINALKSGKYDASYSTSSIFSYCKSVLNSLAEMFFKQKYQTVISNTPSNAIELQSFSTPDITPDSKPKS